MSVVCIPLKTCASCKTRRTPLWRDSEDGTPLCNACGIRTKNTSKPPNPNISNQAHLPLLQVQEISSPVQPVLAHPKKGGENLPELSHLRFATQIFNA
ncbi:ZGLP1-like protein [Mya arenaria]|uniref:ZGLP1-like protein n=1 Tax=Mya arenaria TaxID=6604 RepID=A0ABY7FMA7_MYAAR|nr:ZGLP1-like protein [Mya arenaria]